MVSRPVLVIACLTLLGLLGANTVYQRLAHGAGIEKHEWTTAWKTAVPDVRSISPSADGLLVIGDKVVALLGSDGAVLRRHDRAPIAVGTTGDLDGDGVPEIILAGQGPEPTIVALDRAFAQRWSVAIVKAAPAARLLVVDLDGDGKREVVVGAGASLYALSGAGKPLWKHDIVPAGTGGADAVVRGLDDAKLSRQGQKARYVAYALQDGTLGVATGNGASGWTARDNDKIRRMRTIDVDGDGTSELVTGHEAGVVTVWDVTGKALYTSHLGQAVTEIRAVEIDRDPSKPELAIGSKKGALRVMRGPGAVLTEMVSGKVSAIGGVDLDGDGRDELFVGTEEGGLTAFGPDGQPLGSAPAGGKVEAIVGIASPLRDRLAVVAAGPAVTAWRIARSKAPAWYRPETGAGVGGLAVIVVAIGLLRLRPRPAAPSGPEPDGRALRHLELASARQRIAALLSSGHAAPEQARERLEQIDRQLAKARPGAAASPAPPPSPPPPPRRGA